MSDPEVYLTRDEIERPYANLAVVLEDKRRKAAGVKKTIFGRITTSPEALAKELITTSYDEFKDCTVYWAWLGNGRREAYYGREEAIAATVAKLKEVGE
jgi:hypothetical protein